MNKKLNLVCSILALLCMISMYMPIIAPRYPAGTYYIPEGTYRQDFALINGYYCAREYWDMTRFVFATHSVLWQIALSVAQAALLFWAWLSVRGEAGKQGLVIAVLNLVVVGFTLFGMLRVGWMCRWGMLVVIALDAAAAVVLAANAK